MEKINVIVENSTGSIWEKAELYPGSGLIRFSNGEYIHISRAMGKVYDAPVEVVVPVASKTAISEDLISKSKKNRSRK